MLNGEGKRTGQSGRLPTRLTYTTLPDMTVNPDHTSQSWATAQLVLHSPLHTCLPHSTSRHTWSPSHLSPTLYLTPVTHSLFHTCLPHSTSHLSHMVPFTPVSHTLPHTCPTWSLPHLSPTLYLTPVPHSLLHTCLPHSTSHLPYIAHFQQLSHTLYPHTCPTQPNFTPVPHCPSSHLSHTAQLHTYPT